MAKQHEEQIQACKEIFPTWKALVIVATGLLGTVGVCGIIYGSSQTSQDKDIFALKEKSQQHDAIFIEMRQHNADLDTIKNLLRHPK